MAPGSTAAQVAGEVTLGEISRNVTAMRLDFAEFRTELNNRPDWTDVKRVEDNLTAAAVAGDAGVRAEVTVLAAQVTVLAGRVDKSEGWGVWGGRLVMGGVILALLGIALGGAPVL